MEFGFRAQSPFMIGPAEIPHHIGSMTPDKLPKSAEVDLVSVNAGVRLDTPAQVRAAPRPQPVAARQPPRQL
jgi:hypothetical protein